MTVLSARVESFVDDSIVDGMGVDEGANVAAVSCNRGWRDSTVIAVGCVLAVSEVIIDTGYGGEHRCCGCMTHC